MRTLLLVVCIVLMTGCGPPQVHPRQSACAAPPPMPKPFDPGGMIWLPAALTTLGSPDPWPEESPAQEASLAGFWIDAFEVTNDQYAAFVAATNYVTTAERNAAGSARFVPPSHLADLSDASQWWRIDPTATWRNPEGEGSNLEGRGAEPVVHLTQQDALAYARWLGRDLPTEAEWERAAQGGLRAARYPWGNQASSDPAPRANIWQGLFPVRNTGDDGYQGRAPVGCFAPNGLGLYDMAGNVWEIVADPWPPAAPMAAPGAYIVKGGSYLCADAFCHRYRTAARQPGDPTMGAAHIGFRTVLRGPSPSDAAETPHPPH
ncbi:MAG: formylglycine-generating enzyme family protein [Alphaproteobacteria bacterium]|nr:formylglycine-generating enzyme family protein [Alphaproteobacteria bacterium]